MGGQIARRTGLRSCRIHAFIEHNTGADFTRRSRSGLALDAR